MSPRLLDYLADPNDGGALQLHAFQGNADNTREGILRNPQTNRWYPIREGIPSLFADALRAGAMADEDAAFAARFQTPMREAGCDLAASTASSNAENADSLSPRGLDFTRMESERQARDAQAEDYDRMASLKIYERIETPAYRRAFNDFSALENDARPLLEAGCGTGRFTKLFSELGSEVVAVDLSRDSIERNRVRHMGKTSAPIHYIHADLTHLPLKDAVFGRVAHCGVYEHIPSRAMRTQFLGHAHRALRPDGALLLAAYRYGGLTRLFGKEGEHAGGIPFIRFTEPELRDEVEPLFEIQKFRRSLGVYMSMLVAKPKSKG